MMRRGLVLKQVFPYLLQPLKPWAERRKMGRSRGEESLGFSFRSATMPLASSVIWGESLNLSVLQFSCVCL